MIVLATRGRSDLWDVRELLRLPGADQLVAEVNAELTGHSLSMQEMWHQARD